MMKKLLQRIKRKLQLLTVRFRPGKNTQQLEKRIEALEKINLLILQSFLLNNQRPKNSSESKSKYAKLLLVNKQQTKQPTNQLQPNAESSMNGSWLDGVKKPTYH